MGALTGLIHSRFTGFFVMMTMWFVFVFLVPGVVNKLVAKKAGEITSKYNLEFEKMKIVMDFERNALDKAQRYTNMEQQQRSDRQLVESYWDKEFRKLEDIEERVQEEMFSNTRFYLELSALFPSAFYLSVNNEISSRGYTSFFDFYRYVLELKKRFVRYYVKKKFYSNYSTVESFIKGNENLFYSKSELPATLPAGIGLTLLYSLILFLTSYYILLGRGHGIQKIQQPAYELEAHKTYFIYCVDTQSRKELFNFYELSENAICIDSIEAEDVDNGLEPSQMIDQYSKIKGVSKKSFLQNLKLLGIDDIEKLKRKNLSREMILKIYIAVLFAETANGTGSENGKLIVVNDFIKGKCKDLELKFIRLAAQSTATGKTVLYLSNEMYMVSQPIEEKIKVEKYNCIKVDLDKIILR